MKKSLTALAVSGLVLSACASQNPAQSPSSEQTAQSSANDKRPAKNLLTEEPDPKTLTAKLTAEEKQNPIAKYYQSPPAAVSPKILAQLKTPMKEGDMVSPDNVGKLLDPKTPIKSGYGVMKNGVGYSVTEVVFDGVSFDDYNNYQKWSRSQDGNLIYKIWFPGWHYAEYDTANGHTVIENIGTGLLKIVMDTPAKLSEADQATAKQNGLTTLMVGSTNTNVQTNTPSKAMLLHIRFQNSDGYLVDRTVAWFGYKMADGKLTVDLSGMGNQAQKLEQARQMSLHSAGENSNLSQVIKLVKADKLI